ncbi:MAG: hypothetical protein ACFB51_20165, partial [Anaerolineae bacterium]
MKRIPPYVDILLMLVLATAATLPHYFGTDIPGGTDVRNAFYPWWTFAHNQLMQGRFPLWEPYQFLGGPFVANAQSALFSPVTWPSLLLGPRWGLAIHSTLLLWIGAAGMMVWGWQMRDEELSTNRRIGAFFAGVAFVFSPYVAVRWWTGHITLLTTVMWTPWLLAATLWSLRKPRRWAAYAVSSIPLALILVSGHPPSAFYATLPWVVWLVHLALLRNDWRRPLEQFLLAGVVGSMTAAVQLLPVVEILPYAWSSGQFVTDWFYAFSVRPLY